MSNNGKRILIILSLTLVSAIAAASLGIAYAGGVRGIGLLGVWFFLTFGIIVVLAQLIPAGVLFSSLVGAIFTSLRRGEVPIRAA
ncbi:MAG: hypothetical protein A2170_08010 [Deltaproteobacteria bacterium RBG_13_53_10]|nr:MAG: hypothetical protein A2170_08010 [Deltaproteobacteria bacterium RBG_13_53_10]